ncbi:hypothetical protein Y032_0050g1933 [Ancylostoma ceylanicum]|uniref:Transthyretin-like family protein n=1 Tax=Ancylostoma ceylanicum TaxID=53326 RepID=A0A016U987_9BILA|nr:hypothetical protein Y032_0050g1933 [Ancylostoma ceylanicum]
MRSLCVLLAVVLVAVHAKMQNVTVKGTTICNKKRMADVTVELWERDTREFVYDQVEYSRISVGDIDRNDSFLDLSNSKTAYYGPECASLKLDNFNDF